MSENNPLVSISCLTFNQVNYVRQCLEGLVMQQTDFDYEILVHDDASTDGTQDIIREYEAKYPDKFRVIYQKENQYSKGVMIDEAFQYPRVRGKYIAFCEGDDYWTDPTKLQRQVDFLESHPDYGLVYTEYDRYIEDESKFIRSCFATGYTPRPLTFGEYLVMAGYIAPPTWMFRKELLPKSQISYVDGSYRLSLHLWANSNVKFFPETTAVYRVHSAGVSHVKDARGFAHRIKGIFKIQRDIMHRYPGLITPDIRKGVNQRMFHISLFCNTLPDKRTANLGKRYAKLIGNKKAYMQLWVTKSIFARPFLRLFYQKRRHVRY